MLQQINIRIAEEKDTETIINFNIAIAFETEGLELPNDVISSGVINLMNNPALGFYLVAEIEDVIVGCLMITTEWTDWRNGLFWWIQSVYVKPENRRQGVYRALYNYIKALAKKEPNIRGFRLYVEKNNTIAQNTYKSQGMYETHYKLYEELSQI